MWIKDYNEHRKIESRINPKSKLWTEIDYSTIKDSIEISVLYHPILESDENIKKIIGNNGEYLKGNGMLKLKENRIFRVSEKLYWEFNK